MNDEWTQPCDMCCNARITYLYYGDTNLHYSRCIINCTLWNKSDRFLFGWHHFRWPPVAFQSNCIIQHFLLLLLFSRCLSLSAIRPVLYRPCHHNFVAWFFFSISFICDQVLYVLFVRPSWMRDTKLLTIMLAIWAAWMVLLLHHFFFFLIECSAYHSYSVASCSLFLCLSFFYVRISFSCWNVITMVWLRVQFLFILVN